MFKLSAFVFSFFLATQIVGFCQTIKQKDQKMELPSFDKQRKTPQMEDLGVAVNLETATIKVSAPIIIYGSYYITGEFSKKCNNDEPLTWTFMTVIRRDNPGIWTKPVRSSSNLVLIPKPSGEPMSPSVRMGGYFNIDLRQHFGLPDEPAKYWLIVSLGEYRTEFIPFEVKN